MVFSSRMTSANSASAQSRAITVPRLLFFSFSTVDPPLHFVRDLFAEQTRGLHAKHHDQDGEGKGVGKDAPIGALDDALADTDEKRPHHGAGNGADTAEYRRYEGPQSRQGAGQGTMDW